MRRNRSNQLDLKEVYFLELFGGIVFSTIAITMHYSVYVKYSLLWSNWRAAAAATTDYSTLCQETRIIRCSNIGDHFCSIVWRNRQALHLPHSRICYPYIYNANTLLYLVARITEARPPQNDEKNRWHKKRSHE